MALLPLGLISQGGGAGGAAFELISTQYGNGSATSFTFSSIPQTYKHLQLRLVANSPAGATYHSLDWGGSTYNNHILYGDGTSVSSAFNIINNSNFDPVYQSVIPTTNIFGVAIVDLLDYSSTTKYKTSRKFVGKMSGTGVVSLGSGLGQSTAAITSITISNSGAYASGSRFSLYGIRGA